MKLVDVLENEIYGSKYFCSILLTVIVAYADNYVQTQHTTLIVVSAKFAFGINMSLTLDIFINIV